MARFLILIYGDEHRWDTASESEMAQIDAGHAAFRATAGAAVLAAGKLTEAEAAASLRAGSDGPLVTDGPFVESKEALGGFYVIEAADRDQAISLVSGLAEIQHDHSGVVVHPLVG
jgi:hypothetical protein